MPNLNKVQLMGNLTRDPETKYTPKGTCVISFALAINRRYTTESGEKREETTFVDIEAYGRVAETIAEYVKKGDPLYVEGRLKLDQWDDKQTGQKRSRMKVITDAFQFLGLRKREDDQGGQDYAPPAREGRPAPQRPPRPPADPDLDAAPDDIPF